MKIEDSLQRVDDEIVRNLLSDANSPDSRRQHESRRPGARFLVALPCAPQRRHRDASGI